MHERNAFVTLTYSEENYHPSLNYKHFQDFMRRLRKNVGKVRFFAVGEYGEENLRPHFHALLFGTSFQDDGPIGQGVSRSRQLEDLWPWGYSSFGPVNKQTAAYCARYAVKKVTGNRAETYYTRLDHRTGELVKCLPEMARMSLKPGIGYSWFTKYWREVYVARDAVVQPGGSTVPPPRYYDQLLMEIDHDTAEHKQHQRYIRSAAFANDCTPDRLAVREKCAKARNAFLKRKL